MASNGYNTTATEVLINQTDYNANNINIHSHPVKTLIHTGNIATWNSLKSRKTQVPANELFHSLKATIESWNKNSSSPEETIDESRNCFSNSPECFDSEEERNLVKITVKILLHKFDVSYLREAVKKTLALLQLKSFDMLILSLPPSDEMDTPFEEIISTYWRIMEEFQSNGIVTSISSSDLDQNKLQDLMKIAKVKPEVNQVNLTSCCHMPEDLVKFAKEKEIVLHTHGDQPVMLPDESCNELMNSSCEKETTYAWSTNWVVRYAVVIKCRGVIKSKGYIASLESQ